MWSFQEAEENLAELEFFGIKLGLDQVRELLAYLGDPHHKLQFIHVAGTNGKGSICSMLAEATKRCGLKTALYTSPHLISVRERFRINGAPIETAKFAELMERLRPHIESMKAAGRCPTYFETTTVLAALYFAEAEVDLVVLETGMGGRFDATNVVNPLCSVITGIALDHQLYLGDNLEKIAFEKAGIIKADKPVFLGEMPPEAQVICEKRAADVNAPVYFGQDFSGEILNLAIGGWAWRKNARLAAFVLEHLAAKLNFDSKKAIAALSEAKWPGRFQVTKEGDVLDGAHNPQGMAALVDFLKEKFPDKLFTVVFANFADKNAAENLRIISAVAEKFIFVPITGGRKKNYSANELKEIFKELNLKIPAETAESFQDALPSIKPGETLITGSLYLVGSALAEWDLLDIK